MLSSPFFQDNCAEVVPAEVVIIEMSSIEVFCSCAKADRLSKQVMRDKKAVFIPLRFRVTNKGFNKDWQPSKEWMKRIKQIREENFARQKLGVLTILFS
jgi:hypothetical protein